MVLMMMIYHIIYQSLLKVSISSLRLNNVPVQYASAGQLISFKLKEAPSSSLVSPSTTSTANHLFNHSIVAQPIQSASSLATTTASPSSSSLSSSISSSKGKVGTTKKSRSSATGLIVLPLRLFTKPTGFYDFHPSGCWEFEAGNTVLNIHDVFDFTHSFNLHSI